MAFHNHTVFCFPQAYKEQIKRESVLTATSILNNPIVKARYERFVKVSFLGCVV